MVTEESIKDRLERIRWFSRCGLKEEIDINVPYEILTDWKKALDAFSDPSWENTTAEAQGRLTEHLSSKFPTEFQGYWNSRATEARALIDTIVVPPAKEFQSRQGLPSLFIDCVQWDTLHAVMETAYANFAPHTFFRTLLTVYESGHFPCGWNGKWPGGTLMVI